MKLIKQIYFFSLLFISSFCLASIEVLEFDTPQQESDYLALIQELRCPQCQNNNIADSNATIATDMRNKALELLKQGKSKSDVVDYMVERYGNFVTYDPPLTLATIFLWLTPVLLLILGLGIILMGKRNRSQAVSSSSQNAKTLDQDRLNAILKDKE
ncbi:cytochrome c-type biogenesis protein [Otariodibacter oris]|uniref:Cytochrome c-type biogenesis protein n=1 Tax=Otariodibacter oris TaxID=1032623 RepID=A0A420XFV2_9PAST|nr:cytochrome c-type biogenesis protein [Otariodibacter oris]QGM81619.1 cystathionine gamma-synthase [Otariodibacter oris]RKR71231.1 cytochrome c-type biogenesis protein CcmH [Otariodibacter oris]